MARSNTPRFFQGFFIGGVLAMVMLAGPVAKGQNVAAPGGGTPRPVQPSNLGQPNSGQATPNGRPNYGQYGPPGNGQPQNQPGPGPAGQAQLPVTAVIPQVPEWFPLPADQEKHLNDILVYWEKSSSRVQRYTCKFTRWKYDPTHPALATLDPKKTPELPAETISSGEIKYAAPDKGLFHEDKIEHFVAPRPPAEKGSYQAAQGEKGDHWVCDGKSIFAFDYQNKKLLQNELPPEMQGKAIVDGPLPFLFGAEANKVKDRFWVRVITPKDVKGEFWLEAFPKRREDAANFKRIKIIIDVMTVGNEGYALPKAMAIYDRGPAFQSFAFEDRKLNWSDFQEKLNPFHKEFYEPTTPPGFKKVVERYQSSDAGPRVANTEANRPSLFGPTPLGPTNVPKTQPNANGGTNGNTKPDSTLYFKQK